MDFKRTYSKGMVILCLPLLLFSQENGPSQNNDDQEKLKYEVTVTANRVETPLKETATAVTVITREELEKLQKTTVLEALEEVTGLTFSQNGPAGSQAALYVRGANPEHTKVLIDGIELNDPITPGRTFDMGLLMIESIDRIEIVRGPQSSLFGSDAMGGVVNIITRQGRGKPQLQFAAQGGSYNTLIGNAEIHGGTESIFYSLGTTYYNSEGFSAAGKQYEGNTENDGYRNLTISGSLGFHLPNNIDINLGIRNINSRLEADAAGGDFGDDPNYVQNYDTMQLFGSAKSLFVRNRWESKLTFSYLEYDRKHENPTDDMHPTDSDRSHYRSNLFKLDWQNQIFAHEAHNLTLGAEYGNERGESEYYSESMWGPYESLFPEKQAHNFGLYVQDRVRLAGRFFAALGARYDHHDQAGGAFTYRLAPAYYLEPTGTRFKATLGSGFKAPTLYQLYAPPTFWGPIGSEDLKPESSTGWEGGIEQELLDRSVILGALYFSNTFKELIDFDYVQGYHNVGKATTRGGEFFLRAYPTPQLLLAAEYTRTETRNEDTGEKLLRRPRDKFVAKFNYNFLRRGHLAVNLIHIGEREDLFFEDFQSTRVTLGSYTLLNLAAAYDVIPSLQVFLRMDNILNQEYEMIKGYGTPGFSVYLGFRLKNKPAGSE
jgi:vitamin B12 transporter